MWKLSSLYSPWWHGFIILKTAARGDFVDHYGGIETAPNVTHISSVHSRKRCGQTEREDNKGENERRIPVWGKSRGSPVAYVAICPNQIKGCEKLANLPHGEPWDPRFQIYSVTSVIAWTGSVFKSSGAVTSSFAFVDGALLFYAKLWKNSSFQHRKISHVWLLNIKLLQVLTR